MSGQYANQFTSMLGDWGIGSFVGATLDWLFGLHNSDIHFLNVFMGIFQFTVATFIIYELTYTLGLRKGTNTIQNTWIMYFAVWQMSPKAVKKLTDAYYAMHRLIYGSDDKKQ